MTNWPYIQAQKDSRNLLLQAQSLERDLKRTTSEMQKLRRRVKELEAQVAELEKNQASKTCPYRAQNCGVCWD